MNRMLAAIRQSRAPGAAALAAVGAFWGSFAALIPDIKASVGASDAEFGFALLMSAVGGMAAMVMAPRIIPVLGGMALPVTGAVLSLAALYPIFVVDAVTLGIAMLALGASVALLDITANVEISAREARSGLHLMNVNHAIFSFAFAGAAFGCGLARWAGWSPTEALPVVAVVCLILLPLMRERLSRHPVAIRNEEARRTPWLAIALTGLVLCACFIGESSIEAWSALHIERSIGARPGEGSLGPTVLGLVMGIGRLSGQMLERLLGHVFLVLGSALLAMAGTLVISAAPNLTVAIFGVAFGALGLAAIVPSANSILGARVTDSQRAHALSRAWMFGILGFFLGPAMMGGIAQVLGLRVSFVAAAAILALILPAVWLLGRERVVRPSVKG